MSQGPNFVLEYPLANSALPCPSSHGNDSCLLSPAPSLESSSSQPHSQARAPEQEPLTSPAHSNDMRFPAPAQLRFTYSPSRPFSGKTTVWLCFAAFGGLAGLLTFNFLTQARRTQCLSYASAEYDPNVCQPSPLSFYSTYYTRPVTQQAVGTIGTFPWQTSGFSINSNGPIDYSVLTLNWTANALQCVLFEQSFVLHLDSDASTTTSCYYCGPNLRILCTSVDSERTSIPIASAMDYQALLAQYNILSALTRVVSTTALPTATVLSVRMDHHSPVAGVEEGVLPYNDTITQVSLGTTLGFLQILPNNTDEDVALVAATAIGLSSFIETTLSRDLQPDPADTTGTRRTLLVNYLCKQCTKPYKPWLEIVAIVLAATFAILGPAFKALLMLCEWILDPVPFEDPQQGRAMEGLRYRQPSSPATTPGVDISDVKDSRTYSYRDQV